MLDSRLNSQVLMTSSRNGERRWGK